MRWVRHIYRLGEKRNAYRLLVGKLKGKTPPGRPWYRWMENIKCNLGDVGWEVLTELV
jgi:hypothetical protein